MSDGTQCVPVQDALEIPYQNWRTFVPDVIKQCKEAKRAAVKTGALGTKHGREKIEEFDDTIDRLTRAYEVAAIHDGHGPRSGYWIERACKHAASVKRVLEAEYGTISS